MIFLRIFNGILFSVLLLGGLYLLWGGYKDTHKLGSVSKAKSLISRSSEAVDSADDKKDNISGSVDQTTDKATAGTHKNNTSPQIGDKIVTPDTDKNQQGKANHTDSKRPLNSIYFDETLYEYTSHGLVPKINDKGESVAQTYGHSFLFPDQPAKPTISIVLGHLGLNPKIYHEFQKISVPEAFTLSFSPYGSKNLRWMEYFRKQGHELLLELHVEMDEFQSMYGPLGLNLRQNDDDFRALFDKTLSMGHFYVGCLTPYGGKAEKRRAKMFERLKSISKDTGMVMAAADAQNHPEFIHIDVMIPRDSDEFAIKDLLEQGLILAEEKGHVVIYFDTSPLSLRMVNQWAKGIINGREYQLVSITDIQKYKKSQ
jgi:polysaccharide deacetylase 2 family uncharacterized protein YibQ